jgi:hypothetical protein
MDIGSGVLVVGACFMCQLAFGPLLAILGIDM